MSKIKKIIFYLVIILISILIFIAIIAFSSNNEYPSTFLKEELKQIKSSLELKNFNEVTKNEIYSKIDKIEEAIANEENAISTNNEIMNLQEEIFYLEYNQISH